MFDSFDSEGGYTGPTFKLDSRTLILDAKSGIEIAWLEGHLNMMPGQVIQLGRPNADAAVIATRLQIPGGSQTALLCIDVEVPDAWWESTEAGRVQGMSVDDLLNR